MKVLKDGTLVYIRVALVGLPPLLHDIVIRLVADQSDLEVVGQYRQYEELFVSDNESAPDVIVIGIGDGDVNGICGRLLAQHPQVKIVAVGGEGRRVFLYDLRPHKVAVGEVSPEELLQAIRISVRAVETK